MLPFIGQAVLVGYLSQYFCDKNSLEEELILLRAANNSELVAQVEEEIRVATRDAYLYAVGIILIAGFGVFTFTWTFYMAERLGAMHRIALVSTIYSKVCTKESVVELYYALGRKYLYCCHYRLL